MATKKKTTKKIVRRTPTKAKAVPKQPAPQETAAIPRRKILICDKPFYVDAPNAASLILFEVATRGMKRPAFADFAGRYGLSMEFWRDADTNIKVVLCLDGRVLGDWI